MGITVSQLLVQNFIPAPGSSGPFSITAVPEPSTVALVFLGGTLLIWMRYARLGNVRETKSTRAKPLFAKT